MSKLLKEILRKRGFKLDLWRKDYSELDMNGGGEEYKNVRLKIRLGTSLPIEIIYAKEADYFEINLAHQTSEPWVTTELYSRKLMTKVKLVTDFWEVFENYYVLETRGTMDAYLHFFDSKMRFTYSSKCVNFPILLVGKRGFKIFTPVMMELKSS